MSKERKGKQKMEYAVEIIIATVAMFGSLGGAFLAHRKSTALLAYRLERLEEKVDEHNKVVDRTYRLEEHEAVIEEKIRVANNRISDLEDFHKPH